MSDSMLILGTSLAIRNAVSLARRAALSDMPVLLVGETGTGKELFAREIHRWANRRGALIDVNCGAMPREMAEGMLFGHRRGAYTSAHEDAKGLIEAADGGTLFLDELPSLPLEMQPKLLRVIEEGDVRRLGETLNRRVRARFIAAAQPSILSNVRRGLFREDLYQRLAGIVLRIPTLSERQEDIATIASAFAAKQGVTLEIDAIAVLECHRWPGNVRELRMVIGRGALLARAHRLSPAVVADAIQMGSDEALLASAKPDCLSDKAHVIEVFAENDWNAARTAKALGLGRTTLFKELKALGISLRDVRSNAGMRARRLLGHDEV